MKAPVQTDLTLQEAGGGADSARPEEKLRFWYILVIQLTRQKFDFSQIAMTMPPITGEFIDSTMN